jgi:hypothetical protein
MKTDETKLVDRICQDDFEAFHELVELYKKKVYYLITRKMKNCAVKLFICWQP